MPSVVDECSLMGRAHTALADNADRLNKIEEMLAKILKLVEEVHRCLPAAQPIGRDEGPLDVDLAILRLIYEAQGVAMKDIEKRVRKSHTTIWRHIRKLRDLELLRYNPENPHSKFNVNRRVFRKEDLTRKAMLLLENRNKLPPDWIRVLEEKGLMHLRQRCNF
jgi:DNA-binding transcriptional ArsR family regulator